MDEDYCMATKTQEQAKEQGVDKVSAEGTVKVWKEVSMQ